MNKFKIIIAISMLFSVQIYASQADRSEILVTVGDKQITAGDLEQAVTSSPFATQFNTLAENEQAGLRGDILKGIVATKLLYLEAQSQGIDKSDNFNKELDAFKKGLYYRAYMDQLRSRVTVPAKEDAEFKQEFKGNADALAAARSNYIAEAYKQLRDYTVLALRDKNKVNVHTDKLKNLKENTRDTVLLDGEGIKITYGDIVSVEQHKQGVSEDWVLDRLFQRTELLLVAKEAEEQNLNVDDKLDGYIDERLPSMLVEMKEKEWVADVEAMRVYFNQHPDLSKVPTLWHIGQIVLADKKTAKVMRDAISQGASLFFLAGYYSVDPYGRSRNGDMGWVTEGKGFPQIEEALKKMEDGQVSDIIKTPLGYHILTVLERRPGDTRSFEAMQDRVKQIMTREKMDQYIKELEGKYKVDWEVVKPLEIQTSGNGD